MTPRTRRVLTVLLVYAAIGGGVTWLGVRAHAPDLAPASELWLHQNLMRGVDTGTALTPFVSDGCSGGMSDVWDKVGAISPGFVESYGPVPPWQDCCLQHDLAYHRAGGTRTADASARARLASDERLRACVMATGEAEIMHPTTNNILTPFQTRMAYGALAEAMFQAVRLGGIPCSGLPWRWGFGYPDCSALPD